MRTSSGFEIDIDPSRFDNAELLDALSDMNAGDALAVSRVLTFILGKEDKKRLYDHLREEDGRVPLEKLNREIQDILELAGDPGKNS